MGLEGESSTHRISDGRQKLLTFGVQDVAGSRRRHDNKGSPAEKYRRIEMSIVKNCVKTLAAAGVCAFLAGPAQAQTLINGGFESSNAPPGGFGTVAPGWTSATGGDNGGIVRSVGSINQAGPPIIIREAHDGAQMVQINANLSNGGISTADLTQTVTNLSAGVTYHVDFWIGQSVANNLAILTVNIDGTAIGDTNGGGITVGVNGTPGRIAVGEYRQNIITFVATGTSAVLNFHNENSDTLNAVSFFVDTIQVYAPEISPAAAGTPLAFLACALLFAVDRRRKPSQQA